MQEKADSKNLVAPLSAPYLTKTPLVMNSFEESEWYSL